MVLELSGEVSDRISYSRCACGLGIPTGYRRWNGTVWNRPHTPVSCAHVDENRLIERFHPTPTITSRQHARLARRHALMVVWHLVLLPPCGASGAPLIPCSELNATAWKQLVYRARRAAVDVSIERSFRILSDTKGFPTNHNCKRLKATSLSPRSCSLESPAVCDLALSFANATVWLVGDSVMQQLGFAFVAMLGHTLKVEKVLATSTCPVSWCTRHTDCPAAMRVCFVRTDSVLMNDDELVCYGSMGPGDAVLLNVGLHHNDPRTLEHAISTFAEWASLIYKTKTAPLLIWKDTSPQLFKNSAGGNFAGFKANGRSAAPRRNQLGCGKYSARHMHTNEWRNQVSLPFINALELPVIHTWSSLTQFPSLLFGTRVKGVNTPDCVHVCPQAGVLQAWAKMFAVALESHKSGSATRLFAPT
jgi:hypothetical protein